MKLKLIPILLIGFFFYAFLSTPVQALTEQELVEQLLPLKDKKGTEPDQAKLAELLVKSLRSYESIENYRAIFYKDEKADGKSQEPERIYLKFEKPWKIYMGWLNTHKKGLQVIYERGKNDGKLVIHKPGLLFGLMPVIFLDQDSPWIREGSASYNIEDAGIGTFLIDFSRAVVEAWGKNRLKVKFKDPDDASEGTHVEVTFLESQKNDVFFAYRVSVVFHKENNLPVRMELFDWEEKTTGIYAYQDLKWNLEAEDRDFERQINRHLLKIYNGKRDNAAPGPMNFTAKKSH